MSQIELVRTDAEQPYHMRIVNEGNNTISWRTENYHNRNDALDALRELPGASNFYVSQDLGPVTAHLAGTAYSVIEVDERSTEDTGTPE